MNTPPEISHLRVLVVGAGVIGTVYGAQLAAAGNAVSVLAHGTRTDEVARNGLIVQDALDGTRLSSDVTLVRDAAGDVYDLVLIAVRKRPTEHHLRRGGDAVGASHATLLRKQPGRSCGNPVHSVRHRASGLSWHRRVVMRGDCPLRSHSATTHRLGVRGEPNIGPGRGSAPVPWICC